MMLPLALAAAPGADRRGPSTMPRRPLFALSLPLVLAFCLAAAPARPAAAEAPPATYDRLLVDQPGLDLQALVAAGYDVVGGKPGHYAEIIATPDDQERLRVDGYAFRVLQADLASYYAARLGKGPGFGDFHTYSETVQKLDELHAAYPNLTTARTRIGNSHQGYQIFMMKVSDNPEVDEDEPEVLFDALHHAREPMSTEMCLMLIEYLCANYDSDPYVRWLVDEREIYVVPIVNPDGYIYNEQTNPTGGGMWRKNRRNNGDGTFGVDPNRNYPFQWGCCGGSSGNTSSDTYRGPSPGSEPEVQTIVNFVISRQIQVYQSYHTYSNLTLIPWGWTTSPCPDDALFREIGADLVAGNGYALGTPPELLYVVDGGAFDWAYGEQTTKPKIMAFSNEIGSSTDGFWPLDSRIPALFQDNIGPALTLIEIAGVFFKLRQVAVVGGDGNGRLDPGESAGLVFALQNAAAQATAAGVTVRLFSDDPYLLLPDPVRQVGTLGARASWSAAGSPLPLQLDAACPAGHVVRISARVTWTGQPVDLELELPVGQPAAVFFDDFEGGLANWTRTGAWNLTAAQAYSPANSLTDSPAGNYPNSSNTNAALSAPLDLSSVSAPTLSFWTRYQLEAGYDYGYVEASSDGINWQNLLAVNGTQTAWQERSVSLAAYAGQPAVRLRFRLQTDYSVNYDGWYIDDVLVRGFTVANSPPSAPVALSPVGGQSVGYPVALTVQNAIDADGPDSLTYGFRIFSDELTSQQVLAQTGVPEGEGQTTLLLPAGSLGGGAPLAFYWRAFAEDGAVRGPLCATAGFVLDTQTGVPEGDAGAFLSATPAGGGGTAFSFATRRPGRAALRIYNVRGERIATVFAGDIEGTAGASWDQRDARGAAVAAGVYLARLQGPDTDLTLKVLVVR